MSKQFNALFMNIVLTLAKLLALVRSRICQNACICTDTHFISLVFGVAHKTIFQTIEAFFFLHLSPITCAVSISWNLSHQEKIDVKTNTTFRLYAAYGLVTERARENVYEIEDFFSLVREYACIICTNYLMQRESNISMCDQRRINSCLFYGNQYFRHVPPLLFQFQYRLCCEILFICLGFDSKGCLNWSWTRRMRGRTAREIGIQPLAIRHF